MRLCHLTMLNRIKVKTLVSTVFIMILLLVAPKAGQAAILYLLPERTVISKGEVVRVPIILDTEGEEVNAVEIRVRIPEEIIVRTVETGNSVISLWVKEPYFDEQAKEVKMIGGIPGGFVGQAVLATMLLEIQTENQIAVGFNSESQVLLNDGNGTEAKVSFEGTEFKNNVTDLLKITSPTHSDESVWYRARELTVKWNQKTGAKYSILLDDAPNTAPDDLPEIIALPHTEKDIPDGIHYLHVREEVNGVWSPPSHFRIQIDGTPPAAFNLERDGNKLQWNTVDKASGIKKYTITFAPWPFSGFLEKTTNSPAEISTIARMYGGAYVVKAIDGAGNIQEARYELKEGVVGRVVGVIALIGVVLLALLGLRRLQMRFQKK